MSIINDEIKKLTDYNANFDQLTVGHVVDTNDPQQMGRVRISCPYFGDNETTLVASLPWATPISPLAGINQSAARGRGNDKTVGPIAYGMFNVPKVGSYVLVGCIEGDPRFRIYLGSIYDQFSPHTMPHGRYTYNKTDILVDEPSGPLSSTEDPIQPLYDSQTTSFTKNTSVVSQAIPEPRKNFEYRSRGADHGVAGIAPVFIENQDNEFSSEPDDIAQEFEEQDANKITYTYGYDKSRTQEGLKSDVTEYAYDPQVYSWTTPGFHSISMSDAAENCRVRIRTTHGHQIIMDDTNERVYVSTAGGKTWLEFDEKGNIDLYGERNISIHAEKDINITAGDTFRVKAKNGIHLASEGESRLQSSGDMHMKTSATMFVTGNDVHMKATGGVLNLNSATNTNILATGDIIQTGALIHMNGPAAEPATSAFDAWWTNRIPEHEPWARMMTKSSATDNDSGNTHANAGEYTYNSQDVGRIERGEDLQRNEKWHR